MTTKKPNKLNKIAAALGASRQISLKKRLLGGPLDWLEVGQLLKDRLISRGGRPSDPRWEIKRLVPFRRRTWQSLSKQAASLNVEGRRIGPAQLAAIIIENNVAFTGGAILQDQAQFRYRYPKMQEAVRTSFNVGIPKKTPFQSTPMVSEQQPNFIDSEGAKLDWVWNGVPLHIIQSNDALPHKSSGV